MKIQFTLLCCITAFFARGQAPVNDYFGDAMNQYAVVTGTIDNTPTGMNATWNFSGLTQASTTTDTFAAPTPAELSDYPGTTQVLSTTDDNSLETTQVFHSLVGATLSLTGATNPEFVLDYNSDNALIGTYPLTFGSAVNDAIAGTIVAQGQTANYSGTIDTEVDAYGTLSFDVTGLGSYSGSVTRITTTQNISFSVVIFPGTASITSYNYYDDADGSLVFRTSDGVVSVPGLAINETFAVAEGLITNTLSAGTIEAQEAALLYPNPVDDRLYIEMSDLITIRSVRVIDNNGRVLLLSEKNNNSLDLSRLSPGFYTVLINTDTGEVLSKKLVKR